MLFPKLKLNISSYEFCEKLSLNHEKLQLLPGEYFNMVKIIFASDTAD